MRSNGAENLHRGDGGRWRSLRRWEVAPLFIFLLSCSFSAVSCFSPRYQFTSHTTPYSYRKNSRSWKVYDSAPSGSAEIINSTFFLVKDQAGETTVADLLDESPSASTVMAPEATTTGDDAVKLEAPDTKKIFSIAIPAIGIWLCGPLLSVIDTSTVGLCSGTIQQAALMPAVAVSEYSASLMVRLVSSYQKARSYT
jgi:hypothetical protein